MQPRAAPHEVVERLPRVVLLERFARDRADLLVAGRGHGLVKRLLLREVAVRRAHAHARTPGDVVDLCVEPVDSESLPGRGENALAVAARVGAKWPGVGGGGQAEP